MRGQKKSPSPGSQTFSEEACSAVNLLRSLMVMSEEELLFDVDERSSTRMIYTNGVTLWLLILQRLGGGKTLEEVISHLLAHDFDLFPDNVYLGVFAGEGGPVKLLQQSQVFGLKSAGTLTDNKVCLAIGTGKSAQGFARRRVFGGNHFIGHYLEIDWQRNRHAIA